MKALFPLLGVAVAWLLAGCASSPLSSLRSFRPAASAPSAHTTLAEYKKIAIIVPAADRADVYATVIETAFLDVLLGKGYDLVTRQSLDQVAKELVRTRDEAFDVSTATEIGKLANASHIIVVRMPLFSEARDPKTGSSRFEVRITAQVISVENGRIARVAQDATKFFDNIIESDPASTVEKVARRIAMNIP